MVPFCTTLPSLIVSLSVVSKMVLNFRLQHAQLLTQIFLMAREDDSLSKEAQLTRDYVNELQGFHDRASNAQLIRGLGDGMVHASAFTFPGLEQAVE